MTDRSRNTGDRVLVLNPASGTGEHAPEITARALEHGFEVRETTESGDAARIAREAAQEGVSLLAAAGGDGTIHEVVVGLHEADSIGEVDCAVVPTGTANFFAKSLGIDDPGDAFRAIERGRPRRLDVGLANDEPFLSTCLVGLVAEANTATSSAWKRRLGVFAYVRTALQLLPEYEGRQLTVTVRADESDDRWSGTAFVLLVGNALRFPAVGSQVQADVEDGLLEMTILEDRPSNELLDPQRVTEVLGGSESPIHRYEASSATVTDRRDEDIPYSVDGELRSAAEISLEVIERALPIYVGESYDPDPDR